MKSEVEEIHKSISKSFKKGQKVIQEVRTTLDRLSNFNENNEKTYEMATFALEKVPEIKKRLQKSQDIVTSVENGLDSAIKNAGEAKEKALEVKEELSGILKVIFCWNFHNRWPPKFLM